MFAKQAGRWGRFLLLVVALLPLLTACSQSQSIVNELDERESNEVLVFLARRGIVATKEPMVAGGGGGGGGPTLYSIKVHPNDSTEAMALLNANGLPRRRNQSLLGLFSQGGLVPSEMEQKVKFQEGLSEQIAGTIRRIDGVIDAVVQLSFPEESLLPTANEEKKEKTASVYVKHQGVLDDPNSQLVTKIRRLVSSSIEGLKFDNVTVIADRARFIADPMAAGLSEEFDDEEEFVRIWGVVVGRSSVGHFQTIFFSFAGVSIFFFLLFGWMMFKIFPIMMRAGGVMTLLAPRPYTTAQLGAVEEKKSDEEEKDEEEDSAPEEEEKEEEESMSVEDEAAEREEEEGERS